jgi:hypothetical protein
MLGPHQHVDWVAATWTVVIAIVAVVVYAYWASMAVRPVEPSRAALPDGGLRAPDNLGLRS